MEELWLKNDQLVPEKEWINLINNLKTKETFKDKNKAKMILKEKLLSSIKQRLPGEKFGILFSGGVDSSFIAAVCKSLGADFVCYSVGFQEGTKTPEDIIEAQKVAKQLGFELKYNLFNLKEAEEVIKNTVNILKPHHKIDVVNVGVGSVVLAAIGLAKKDKVNYFFSGLGSEEIFAGYERHSQAKDVNAECWKGLQLMWSRDLVRDFTLAKELKVKIRTPFLDSELIKEAMKVPGEWKISGEQKKLILREIAEELLEEFAWRKKKAAQYGSCFDKAIEKLAHKNEFRLKKDYIESI